MNWTIYCHTHVETNRRYVGLTKRTMLQRWDEHILIAMRMVKNGRWHFPNTIRKYGSDAFSHQILEVCSSLEVANLAEECWIELFDTRNPEKGFNTAKGGQHTPHPVKNPWDRPGFREKHPSTIEACFTPEARAKQKASLNTSESRAKRSAATQASMADPVVQEKRQVFQKDPEYRERISQSLKASLATEEAKIRQSEAARLANARPEVKAKISTASRAVQSRPDVKERHREAVREAQNRPEVLEKRRAYRASPETKAKISKSSLGRKHSPEAIARMRDMYWLKIVEPVLMA